MLLSYCNPDSHRRSIDGRPFLTFRRAAVKPAAAKGRVAVARDVVEIHVCGLINLIFL